MRILVTGSNGLLGSVLIEKLSENGHDVFAISKKGLRKDKNINYLELDLSKEWDIECLPKNIDSIYHLAQSNEFRNFPHQALDIFTVNLASTAKLLDYAYKENVKKFVFTSSGGIYGNSNKPFSEEQPFIQSKELGYYLGTKASSEILVESYSSKIITVILRPFFIYGKNQNKSMLIPRLITNVKNGNEISIQKKGGIKINPIHVSDASEAAMNCLNLEESSIYNLGGPEILSLEEIINLIGSELNIKPKIKYSNDEPLDLISNIEKMKKDLFSPKIKISDYIKDL